MTEKTFKKREKNKKRDTKKMIYGKRFV